MAMFKSITTSFGITANYHKIISQNIDWLNKVCSVEIGSWVDSASRQSNPSMPIMKTEMFFNGDNFTFTVDSNNIKLAYQNLMAARLNSENVDSNIFTGATEV